MKYHGHVEEGKIVLDEDVTFPNGATVTIELEQPTSLHPELEPWVGILESPESSGNFDSITEYKESRIKKHLQ